MVREVLTTFFSVLQKMSIAFVAMLLSFHDMTVLSWAQSTSARNRIRINSNRRVCKNVTTSVVDDMSYLSATFINDMVVASQM